MAVLAAAEDGTIDGAIIDIYIGFAHEGHVLDQGVVGREAAAAAEDVAAPLTALDAGAGDGVHLADGAAVDVDGGGACRGMAGDQFVRSVAGAIAHAGHVAAAIDVAHHVATSDVDHRVAVDAACRGRHLVAHVGQVEATARAVDRAGHEHHAVGGDVGADVGGVGHGILGQVVVARGVVGKGHAVADGAALDGDGGDVQHVAVVARAVDRAADAVQRGVAVAGGVVDDDLGVVDVGAVAEVVLGGDGVGVGIVEDVVDAVGAVDLGRYAGQPDAVGCVGPVAEGPDGARGAADGDVRTFILIGAVVAAEVEDGVDVDAGAAAAAAEDVTTKEAVATHAAARNLDPGAAGVDGGVVGVGIFRRHQRAHRGQRAAAIDVVPHAAAGHLDVGRLADPACRLAQRVVVVEVDTAAAAVEVANVGALPVVDLAAADFAAVHLHQRGVEHVAVLARAEDAAHNLGTGMVGCLTYNDARDVDVGQVVVALARGTAAGAEDTAVVAAFAALAGPHVDGAAIGFDEGIGLAVAGGGGIVEPFGLRTDVAAGDLHPGAATLAVVLAFLESLDVALLEVEAVVGAVGSHRVVVTHRGHRAAAEEGVAHPAAGHVDVRVAVDATGRAAQLVGSQRVHTAAAAVDVATEDGARGVAVDGGQRVGLLEGMAHDAARDVDQRAVEHVAVGAAAEDATHDGGTGLDVHLRGVDIGQVGHLPGAIACDTAAAAEDGAFVPAHRANHASVDGDVRVAGGIADGVIVAVAGGDAVFQGVVVECLLHGSGSTIGIGVVGAHRGDGAAAEDVVIDGAAAYLDIGVAVDAAGRGAEAVGQGAEVVHTAAAAVDVATVDRRAHTALVLDVFVDMVEGVAGAAAFVEAFGLGLEALVVHRYAADGAALDADVGVLLHVAVLAAAEDGTAHHSRAVDGDEGVVGEGSLDVFLADGAVLLGRHAAARTVDHAADGTQVAVVLFDEVDGRLAGTEEVHGAGVGGVVLQVGAGVADPGGAANGDVGVAGAVDIVVLDVERAGAEGVEVVGAHRSKGAAAVDGVAHLAAADDGVGVAVDAPLGSREVTAVGLDTAAAGVDVAQVDMVLGGAGGGVDLALGVGHQLTHGAGGHVHAAVVQHVAALAAAEDGADDVGRAANVHLGRVDEGVGGVIVAGLTQAAAEDEALVVHGVAVFAGVRAGKNLRRGAHLGVVQFLHAHGAAADVDRGAADVVGVAGDGLAAGVVGVFAHRSHLAAAVDVALHGAGGHVDGGVALDEGHRLVAAVGRLHALAGAEDAAAHRGVGTDDVHCRVAHYRCLGTAAVDVAADGGQGIVAAGSHIAGGGVGADGHQGVGGDGGRAAQAAAEDVARDAVALLDVHDVHLGALQGGAARAVSRQVAAAVDVGHIEGAGGALGVEDVDGNLFGDVAVDIGAAEGVGDGAAHQVEGDVAGDVGRLFAQRVAGGAALRAAVDVLHGAAPHVEGDVAGEVGQVAAAVDFLDLAGAALDGEVHVAGDIGHVVAAEEGDDELHLLRVADGTILVADVERLGTADGTAGVRACKGGGVVATQDGGRGFAEDIGGTVGVASALGQAVAGGVAVAAGEEGVDAATFDGDEGIGIVAGGSHVGGAAAAVDHLDGVLAAVDVDGGFLLACRGGLVVGLVAAAVDALQGEVGRGMLLGVVQFIDGIKGAYHVGQGVAGVVDVHLHLAGGGAVLVVGAEDVAADDDGVVAGDASGLACDGGVLAGGADVDRGVAAHKGGHVGTVAEGYFLAQTAAEDVLLHGAAEDVHGGAAADVGQSAAAIDGAVDHDLGLEAGCGANQQTENECAGRHVATFQFA